MVKSTVSGKFKVGKGWLLTTHENSKHTHQNSRDDHRRQCQPTTYDDNLYCHGFAMLLLLLRDLVLLL